MEPGFPEFFTVINSELCFFFSLKIKIKKRKILAQMNTVIFGSCAHLFLVLTFSSFSILRLYSFHHDSALSPAATDNPL